MQKATHVIRGLSAIICKVAMSVDALPGVTVTPIAGFQRRSPRKTEVHGIKVARVVLVR